MRERIKHVIRRAQFAAAGAAIGGGLGGLIGRNAASTGAGFGALIGATIAEKMGPVDAMKQRFDRGDDAEAVAE
jgi:outer membrane lipoprotein SlyB